MISPTKNAKVLVLCVRYFIELILCKSKNSSRFKIFIATQVINMLVNKIYGSYPWGKLLLPLGPIEIGKRVVNRLTDIDAIF